MLADGVVLGLVAGAIFAVAEMIVAGSATGPWRAFASIVMGPAVLERDFSVTILIVSVVVHFGLSAIYGGVWGLLIHELPERVARSLPAVGALGVAFGLALWIVNFGIFGSLFFEWFLGMGQTAQILLHALAFGLPLGIGTWVAERSLHPLPRERIA